MVLKILLISLVVILGLIVVLPFVLNIAGFQSFGLSGLGSIGGAPSAIAGEGLLHSGDGGETWENAAISKTSRVYFPARIFDLTFHPQNPDLVFVGSKSSGLWKSADAGRSWEKVFDRGKVLAPTADVYKIAISRFNPKVMYLAVYQNDRGRVLKSEDGGESWREVYFVTANRYGVFDLYVNSGDADRVIIVTGQGGVLETRNGGKTWRVVKWFSEPLAKLLVNPVFMSEMFVLTARGNLFKTFDGGENWADLNERQFDQNQPLPYLYPQPQIALNPLGGFFQQGSSIEALVSDPSVFTTLYLGSGDGILRSLNGGFTWERLKILIPPEALPVRAVAVHPRSSNIIFAGASSQLHRSDDGGTNWRVEFLPTKNKIKNILIHPSKPEIMFAILEK